MIEISFPDDNVTRSGRIGSILGMWLPLDIIIARNGSHVPNCYNISTIYSSYLAGEAGHMVPYIIEEVLDLMNKALPASLCWQMMPDPHEKLNGGQVVKSFIHWGM